MDTLLYRGDHFLDSRGLPVAITGDRALIQRALIRLQVQRGHFAEDRELGSDLYKLRRSGSEENTRIAMNYIREALLTIPETDPQWVRLTPTGQADLLVEIGLAVNGINYQVEVTL